MDTHVGMMTAAELQGLPTVRATFERPPDRWMLDPMGKGRYPVLSVSAEVLPSLNLGQEVQQRTVHRAGTRRWVEDVSDAPAYLADPSRATGVAAELADEVDRRDPSRLGPIVDAWEERGGKHLTVGDALRALHVVDLQTVIESILSREWSRRREDSRWHRALVDLSHAVGQDGESRTAGDPSGAELTALRQALRGLRMPHDAERRMEGHLRGWECLAELTKYVQAHVDRGAKTSSEELLAPLRDAIAVGASHLESLHASLLAAAADAPASKRLRILADQVGAACAREREQLHLLIAKAHQKPDHCLPRSLFGQAGRSWFPRADSWDEDWYVGPDLAATEESA